LIVFSKLLSLGKTCFDFFSVIGWHVTYHNLFIFVMGKGYISKHGMPILASVPFFKNIWNGHSIF
jgi:hypothetical protein